MQSITLLIKPASSLCNMRCRYCFYEDVAQNRSAASMGLMTTATAETLIYKTLAALDPNGVANFLFQGGEPTLAGLEFYQTFIDLEQTYRKPGQKIFHSIQTNGLAVDEKWAQFFKAHHFLVGLSLDGTQALHDHLRIDSAGNGTWARVTAALCLLQQHQVETNLLCVITRQAARKPHQIYHSLRQLGDHPLQFIPCLDPLEEKRGAMPYSLTPAAYGKFLCQIFDCWYQDWRSGHYVSIRTFDDYLRHLLRLPPTSCACSGSCGHYLVVEGDGSLYPCDFYVLDQWCLGNIHQIDVAQALSSPVSQAFLVQGQQRPAECAHCRYAPLCRGGCKRDFQENGSNYYCPSYQAFFPYAIERLEIMARSYLQNR